MATYIMLSTLTDEGRKTLKERPERLQEVNKEVETMGGRVTAQYKVIAPEGVGRYVHEAIPGSRLRTLDAVGHCPNLSAPAETAAAIRDFLPS